MAYYLALTSGNEYVDISSPVSVTGDGVLAEIDFEYKGASNDVICGGTSFSDYWRINNDNQFRVSISGSASNLNITTPLVVGEKYTLRLVRTGVLVEVQDGSGASLTGMSAFNTSPFVIGKIGSFHNGSSNLTMDLYNFKAGSLEEYNPNLSNGTGSTLPTVSGSNQGTLVNFPTDDSQWVFYDDGGGGVLDVSPSSISSEELFGSATVVTSGVSILPPSIDTQEGFGTASVTSSGVDIQPPPISSSEAVGQAQIDPLGFSLSPSAIPSQEAIQEPVVAVGLTVLAPDSVGSEEFVSAPTLDLLLKQLLVPSVPDTFSVGRPVVVGGDRIVIPIIARTNFTKIQGYLKTLGFSGTLEDVVLAWLRSEGYEGQWNDAWYKYLEDLGHTGALPERLYRWKRGLLDNPWILSGGVWNDGGIWQDGATWSDS